MKSKNIIAYALTISLLLTPTKINNKEYRYIPPEKVKISSQTEEENEKENNKEPKLIKNIYYSNTLYTRQQNK